jgi:NAD(P)-dependent dehydrogenase (short-subunit alcohol dehydrogenase family)
MRDVGSDRTDGLDHRCLRRDRRAQGPRRDRHRGGPGIGKAIADKLADEGATVVVADLNGPAADQAAPTGGAAVECDVSSTDDVKRLVSETLSRFGKLDVLVNNAAIHPSTAWDHLGFDEWRRIMATSLDAVYLTCREAYPPMREAGYGRIVNLASNAVLAGVSNMAHYAAAKGGVVAFTRALAREVGKHGSSSRTYGLAFRRAAEGIRTLDLLHGKQNVRRRFHTNMPANGRVLCIERAIAPVT